MKYQVLLVVVVAEEQNLTPATGATHPSFPSPSSSHASPLGQSETRATKISRCLSNVTRRAGEATRIPPARPVLASFWRRTSHSPPVSRITGALPCLSLRPCESDRFGSSVALCDTGAYKRGRGGGAALSSSGGAPGLERRREKTKPHQQLEAAEWQPEERPRFVDPEALDIPLVPVHVCWQEVQEVLEAASPVHFGVVFIDELFGAVDLFIHRETMDAGNRNP
uniref:Uncharacterized protein n=1 Tax=Oryza rufipogon TaxID=4529 RepID=A0A0E0PFD3_ORYRU